MALCEKSVCPHPLLKHNCGLSHLSSVSLATSRPDYCHTCSQSRNHLNRTCLTKWSRPKDPQKLHIMLRSKEIQEQMRKKVIEIYQSGKGYKAISKPLGLQRTTVRAIIHKWRKHGTVVNLPRSGRPTKITPRAQRRLIQEVTKDPTTTSKELQASLSSVRVSVHDSTIRKRLGKNGLHGRVTRPKPLLSKKNIKAHLSFARKHLDDPQDFWENTLWTDKTKVELFGRCVSHYIWRKSNTATLKSTVNAAIYQEILEHFMLPSADKLYGDADFIFQQDLAPAHTPKLPKAGSMTMVLLCLIGQQTRLTWTP